MAALVLVVSSRLPLSRTGIGSALTSVRVAALAGQVGNGTLKTAGLVLVSILGSGILLGPLCLMRGKIATIAWWVGALFVLLGGIVLVALQRTNSGGAVVGVLTAGVVLCASGVAAGRSAPAAVHPPAVEVERSE